MCAFLIIIFFAFSLLIMDINNFTTKSLKELQMYLKDRGVVFFYHKEARLNRFMPTSGEGGD